MIFRERITETLKQCNYTQKELAQMLNISESNITNWKKGQNLPSLDILYKLCVILDESADYLLGLEDATGDKVYNSKYNIGTINNHGKIDMK